MDIAWIGAANGSGSNHWGSRDGAHFLKEQLSGSDLIHLARMPIIEEDPTGFAMKALPALLDFNHRLALKTANAHRAGDFPVIVGGDHSCAIGTWSGIFARQSRKLGMLWIDAHMDAHTFNTSETGNIHGMPLATLLGRGFAPFVNLLEEGPKLDPKRTVLFGVRSYERGEAELLQSLNVRVYLMEEIFDRGFAVCFREASDRVRGGGGLPFGISLDLDALDPAQVPSVGTPVRAGLDAGELLRAFPQILGDEDLQAFELVEFNPHEDVADRGLSFVIEVLNLVQNARLDLSVAALRPYTQKRRPPAGLRP
ncbi:MAG: arginase [Bdellovibrionaceae bacterium]|nr:arginase [Pseudobdellovibrionaceae bacterium]